MTDVKRGVFPTVAMMLLVTLSSVRAEPRVIELAIRNGEVSTDARVVRVRQGDEVTLRCTTDKTLTIHLHGYDIEKQVAPGPPVFLRFTANATGRYPIEAHVSRPGGDRTLGYLEVHPR